MPLSRKRVRQVRAVDCFARSPTSQQSYRPRAVSEAPLTAPRAAGTARKLDGEAPNFGRMSAGEWVTNIGRFVLLARLG